MTTLKECYAAAGADYEDAMRRLVAEARLDRFLAMFLQDQNYEALCAAMDSKNYEDAFRAIHTIKGISLNLALTDLGNACVGLTENLRAGQPNEATLPLFEALSEQYKKTANAIQEHLGL